MTDDPADSIIRGLQQVLDYARSGDGAARVHTRPRSDVRAIRARLGIRRCGMESARTACVARIVALAEYVWRDPDDARRFLTTPHPELGDRPPIEVAADESGARRVEQILQGILHGFPA